MISAACAQVGACLWDASVHPPLSQTLTSPSWCMFGLRFTCACDDACTTTCNEGCTSCDESCDSQRHAISVPLMLLSLFGREWRSQQHRLTTQRCVALLFGDLFLTAVPLRATPAAMMRRELLLCACVCVCVCLSVCLSLFLAFFLVSVCVSVCLCLSLSPFSLSMPCFWLLD